MGISKIMSSKPAVSVIVPIYNVAPYLRYCLDSLIGQTYSDIEIIGVDDGSTDESGAILDEYAAKDTRVTALHQENAGVSAARNAGIEIAKGEYLAFVDGDDWMDLKGYENLLKKIQTPHPDIVIFQNRSVENGTIWNNFSDETMEEHNPPFNDLVMKYGAQVTSKLFRRQFIRQADVAFIVGVRFGEDTIFCTESFAKAENILLLGRCYYFYRLFRSGSAMDSFFSVREILKTKRALEQRPFYNTISLEKKIIIDVSFCGAFLYRLHLQNAREFAVLEEYLRDLEQAYDKKSLAEFKSYAKFKKEVREKDSFNDKVSFWQKVFSIKNSRDKKYKVVRFLGAVFKFERKTLRVAVF